MALSLEICHVLAYSRQMSRMRDFLAHPSASTVRQIVSMRKFLLTEGHRMVVSSQWIPSFLAELKKRSTASIERNGELQEAVVRIP